MYTQPYNLSKYVTSISLDSLFQVHDWLNLKQKDIEAIIKNEMTRR